MAERTDSRVHVNRTEELARFEEMISGTGTPHVLLIQAEPGMGKSSLLREFWDRFPGSFRALVDLKPRTHSVEAVLGELCSFDLSAFPRFFEKIEELSTSGGVNISQSEIKRSQLAIQLSSTGAEDREMRRQALTRAFFSDIADSDSAVETALIIFDTHENASDDVKDWLARIFLPSARAYRRLVIVVAGQSIPQLGVGWDDWLLEQTLRPLGPDHLGEYVRRVRLQLSENEIALLYDLTDGVPLGMSIEVGKLLIKRGRRDA